MTDFYDALETRTAQERAEAIAATLPDHIAHAQRNAPYFAESLAGVDAAAIDSVDALASLPVLRKSALIERQQAQPPFGGLARLLEALRVMLCLRGRSPR